jgi:hypothetical protein
LHHDIVEPVAVDVEDEDARGILVLLRHHPRQEAARIGGIGKEHVERVVVLRFVVDVGSGVHDVEPAIAIEIPARRRVLITPRGEHERLAEEPLRVSPIDGERRLRDVAIELSDLVVEDEIVEAVGVEIAARDVDRLSGPGSGRRGKSLRYAGR